MSDIAASIIIPVYQAERYIRQCLDSVEKQTFPNFEVIVIDDGSKDASGAICDEYAAKDERFHVYHQQNMGVTAARKNGLSHAKGKYIFWIDADDYADIRLVEKAVSEADKREADIVIWNIMTKREDGTVTDKTHWEEGSLKDWRRSAVMGRYSVLWAGCAKRSLWERVEFPDSKVRAGEDGYLMMDLLFKANSIASVSDTLYYHLDDSIGSISNRKTIRYYFDNYQLWVHRYKFSKNNFPDLMDFCGQRALSAAVKSYCMDLKFQQFGEEEKQNILDTLAYFQKHVVSGRTKEKILSWAIRNHHYWLCDAYIQHKLKKGK